MQIPDNVTPLDQARPEGDRAWNEKKKERTRTQLLEAASRLIGERGVDATTVNDIATEAAVAPGTFYNYFPALDAMLVDSPRACAIRSLRTRCIAPGRAIRHRVWRRSSARISGARAANRPGRA